MHSCWTYGLCRICSSSYLKNTNGCVHMSAESSLFLDGSNSLNRVHVKSWPLEWGGPTCINDIRDYININSRRKLLKDFPTMHRERPILCCLLGWVQSYPYLFNNPSLFPCRLEHVAASSWHGLFFLLLRCFNENFQIFF